VSDEYDLPTDETAARLERIERRLDLMGQKIAFLEGYVMGVRKDPELSRSLVLDSTWEKNQEKSWRRHRRFMRIMLTIGWTLVAFELILVLFLP
jgi:hypothetical protein